MDGRLTIDQLNDTGCMNMLCAMVKLLAKDFRHLVHTTFLTWAREILMDRGYSNCERGMHPTAPTRAQD